MISQRLVIWLVCALLLVSVPAVAQHVSAPVVCAPPGDCSGGGGGGGVVTLTGTQTLTNKTIDGDLNTVQDLANASIKAAAAIDATKIGAGGVTSTEYGYIGGLTSDAQTQLDSKLATADAMTSSQVVRTDQTGSGFFRAKNEFDFVNTTDHNGATGWSYDSSACTHAVQASESKAPGIWRHTLDGSSAAASNCSVSMSFTNGLMFDPGIGAIQCTAIVRLSDLSGNGSGDEFDFIFGLGDTAFPTNTITFYYDRSDSANWRHRVTTAGAADAANDVDVAVAEDVWINLTFTVNAAASQVLFYVDGVLVETETATIPTTPLSPLIDIQRVGTPANARYYDTDLVECTQLYSTSR